MLSHRSNKKELLDRDDIPFADIRRNMEELDIINYRLGGHKITLEGVKELVALTKERPIRILEIGCGDGNNLRRVKKWFRKKNIQVSLAGIDINKACIEYARSIKKNSGTEFICDDYKNVELPEKPHIIFSSLFCHHFTDGEIVDILKWKKENSRTGFFINDLHRHPIARFSIQFLTQLFSKSYLVKNDAPISVERSFRRTDWNNYIKKAQIANGEIKWRWAFRWLIIYKHASIRS